MKVLALFLIIALSKFAYSKTQEDQRKLRKYPGGWDEMDIEVRANLPDTYKTPRKYYEAQVLNNDTNRMPASENDDD